MAGAQGFFNAPSPMAAIGGLIGGLASGAPPGMQGARATYAALRARGLSDEDAKAAVLNPEMLKALIPSAVPKFDAWNNGQLYGRFNPATGRVDPQGASPEFKTLSPGQTGGYATPPIPSAPAAPSPGIAPGQRSGTTPPSLPPTLPRTPASQPAPPITFGDGSRFTQGPGGFVPVASGGIKDPEPGHEWNDPSDPSKGQRLIRGSGAFNTQVAKLADDFRADKNIQKYQTVAPIIASAREAAQRGGGAADLNLIYAFAKIVDPESVVREGETVMVTRTGSLPEWVVGQIQRLNAGQQLTADVRQRLMAELESRTRELEKSHNHALSYYNNRAKSLGVDPSLIQYGVETTPLPPPRPQQTAQAPSPPQGGPTYDRPEIAEARMAIGRGVPRSVVEQRLRARGIPFSPRDLDLQ